MTIDTSHRGNRPLKAWVRALEMTAPISKNPSVTLPVVIDGLAEQFGGAPALLDDADCLTFQSLAERSHRYARWALRQGLSAGEVVCLLMPNCPEYMAIWLGITRIGGIVALVNSNLAREALAHSIDIVAPKMVIVAAELARTLAEARPLIAHSIRCWVHGNADSTLPRIDAEITHYASDRLAPSECPEPTIADRTLYIYTSGTTGLP